MQNFNINIPSIPTGAIQFKIQDAKFKGFNSRSPRFKDNLSYLASHFVNSFPNLQPPKPKQPEESSKSPISTNLSSSFQKESQPFRWMVADDKKNLLLKYEEEYKDYRPRIPGQNKYDKGYSFSKSTPKDTLDSELSSFSSQNLDNQSSVFDNYFFHPTEESIDQQEEEQTRDRERRREDKIARKRVIRKSAAFQGEDRWKSFERQLSSKISPGPGYYKIDTPSQPQSKKASLKLQKQKSKKSIDMSKIMGILNTPANPQQASPVPSKKSQNESGLRRKKSSMFIEGNLDRFGQQMYPISPKLKVPGPGAYHYHDSLEDKANRVLIVEQQRKLLREWYNNS